MKWFRKLRHRWECWKDWNKLSSMNPVRKFLIFLRIVRCTWFEQICDYEWEKESEEQPCREK